MPVRVPDPHWDRVHRALMQRIERRERELLELHDDYIALELRHNQTLAYLRRVWDRADLERANRLVAQSAANE